MANERILVVDDESQIVRLCNYILTEQEYTVQGVTDASEAIVWLESEPWDLLIVDIKMPDIDGLTLLRRAKDLDPNLIGVVITGYATMARAIEALHSGARGFVLKPFGMEDLLTAVEAALDQKRREQERLLLRAQLPILEVSQALMTEGDVKSLARRLLDVVMRQMTAERAALVLLDAEADDLYLAGAVGLQDEVMGQMRMPASQSVIGQVLLAEEPLILREQAQVNLPPAWWDLLIGSGENIGVLVPLRTTQRNIGVLSLSRTTAGRPMDPFRASDLNLLSIIGRQIATGLDNARMYAMEKRRIAALARALEKQQELDRLKNEFIQNVSHELRTPLAMILGYAEMLVSGELGELGAGQRGPLAIILQRAFALKDLVENITAMLVNESRKPRQEEVSLSELVASTVADFQELAARSGLTLQGQIEAQGLLVLGNAEHLRRMIENLVSNALKFTPAGGVVTVRLSSKDGQATLQVSDTGIGISAEHIEHVFERFYQVNGATTRQYGGSGLGLALVREVIEKHGGTIEVESQVGRGSSFTVWLPLATAA